MTSRTMTVRAQLGLLAGLTCTVFILALGAALWQMQAAGVRLSGFIDKELAAVQDAFNQWQAQSGRPLCQLSVMLAHTVNH